MIDLQVIAFLKQFSLFDVYALPELIKGTHHILFCHLSLLSNVALLLIKSLVLNREVITLGGNLGLKIFDVLHQGRVSFSQKHDIMTLMVAMDNALRTHRRRFALEAEIIDFFFRVVRA